MRPNYCEILRVKIDLLLIIFCSWNNCVYLEVMYVWKCEDYSSMQRAQGRFITYYRFLALCHHCSVGFRLIHNTKTIRGLKRETSLNGEFLAFAPFVGTNTHDLLFVHCVPKQPLILIPDRLTCVQLECHVRSMLS